MASSTMSTSNNLHISHYNSAHDDSADEHGGGTASETTHLLSHEQTGQWPPVPSADADVTNPGGISWYFAVFLIVNAALGAGLLNFAKSFDNAGGVFVSTIVHLTLVLVIVGALLILAYSTDMRQSANFQDVVYSWCGKRWQTINSLCIILYMFGCCVTFFIIIGDQLDQILTCIYGEATVASHWYFQRKFTITVTSLLFILPLCYPKRIDFLTYPSTFAVIAIVYVVILIPIKYTQMDTSKVDVKTRPEHWMDVFTVIPVICFGYQCHVNAVPIYACLKRKNLREFTKSIVASIVIVFAAYQVTATYGYLSFGRLVDDDLLKSYDSNDVYVFVAIIMFLIKTYTSYPLNLFCARTAIEGLWIEMFRLDSHSIVRYELPRRVFIVTTWFVLSLLIAIYIPNITVVIHYLGALAATFMFVFPGLCLLFYSLSRDDELRSSFGGSVSSTLINTPLPETDEELRAFKRKTNLLLAIAIVYITIGVFIMGLVVSQSFILDLGI